VLPPYYDKKRFSLPHKKEGVEKMKWVKRMYNRIFRKEKEIKTEVKTVETVCNEAPYRHSEIKELPEYRLAELRECSQSKEVSTPSKNEETPKLSTEYPQSKEVSTPSENEELPKLTEDSDVSEYMGALDSLIRSLRFASRDELKALTERLSSVASGLDAKASSDHQEVSVDKQLTELVEIAESYKGLPEFDNAYMIIRCAKGLMDYSSTTCNQETEKKVGGLDKAAALVKAFRLMGHPNYI
jgi:hypothetical protein